MRASSKEMLLPNLSALPNQPFDAPFALYRNKQGQGLFSVDISLTNKQLLATVSLVLELAERTAIAQVVLEGMKRYLKSSGLDTHFNLFLASVDSNKGYRCGFPSASTASCAVPLAKGADAAQVESSIEFETLAKTLFGTEPVDAEAEFQLPIEEVQTTSYVYTLTNKTKSSVSVLVQRVA